MWLKSKASRLFFRRYTAVFHGTIYAVDWTIYTGHKLFSVQWWQCAQNRTWIEQLSHRCCWNKKKKVYEEDYYVSSGWGSLIVLTSNNKTHSLNVPQHAWSEISCYFDIYNGFIQHFVGSHTVFNKHSSMDENLSQFYKLPDRIHWKLYNEHCKKRVIHADAQLHIWNWRMLWGLREILMKEMWKDALYDYAQFNKDLKYCRVIQKMVNKAEGREIVERQPHKFPLYVFLYFLPNGPF